LIKFEVTSNGFTLEVVGEEKYNKTGKSPEEEKSKIY